MKLLEKDFIDNNKFKFNYIECTGEVLYDSVINYCKHYDKYLYYSLHKDALKHTNKTFKKIMKNGGGSYLLDKLNKINEKIISEEEIELLDDDEIVLLEDDDDNTIYKYNEELDMYVYVSSEVFVNPDNHGAEELLFYSYIKIIGD